MQKGKNSWTRYRFGCKSKDIWVAAKLSYLVPESFKTATNDAIHKAEFLFATQDFDFDENNFTLILIADA